MSKVKAKIIDQASVQISIEATMVVWEWEKVLKDIGAQSSSTFELTCAIKRAIEKLKHEAIEEFSGPGGL